jgi:hypothetical protein
MALFDYVGWTPEEIAAEEAFTAQLKYTAEMIDGMVKDGGHHHFTDDCGDYLFAALDISRDLQAARMNGPEDLIEALKEYAVAEEGYEGEDIRKIDMMACDGVSPGLMKYIDSISKEQEVD